MFIHSRTMALAYEKGAGSYSPSACPGNMGLRIASTIRISNERMPTPALMYHKSRTDGFATGRRHDTTLAAQTLHCSVRHGCYFCEVYVPTGQTPVNVLFNMFARHTRWTGHAMRQRYEELLERANFLGLFFYCPCYFSFSQMTGAAV